MRLGGWQQLRFGDVATFLAVRRCGTVSGAARELRTSPSQVSKAIARLETQLGKRLLVRRADGVVISDDGRRSLPDLEEIVARARRLEGSPPTAREITVAASPPLSELILPALAEPELRLRALELPPAAIRAYAGRGLFDVAVTSGTEGALPPSWIGLPVGRIGKALFGTPALRERARRTPVAELPFVQLGHCLGGEYVDAEDGGPVPIAARRVAHQAATLSLGFAIAARTDSLVFAPILAARPWLDGGLLARIPAPGWDVDETLQLSCNQDRVTARQQARVEAILKERLGG